MFTRLGLAVALYTGLALAQSPSGAAGHWEGAIQTPNGDLQLHVDLAQEPDKSWIGTMSIPAHNARGLGMTSVEVKGDTVIFTVRAPGDPRFEGTVKEGKMSGNLAQGGHTMTFQLTRTGEAKIDKLPPNPPVSPELEGTWEGTLDANGKTYRLRITIANKAGVADGMLVSLDQGGSEIPIGGISETAAKVRLQLPIISGGFEGERKDNQLTGTWTQGPGSLPLTLTKAAK